MWKYKVSLKKIIPVPTLIVWETQDGAMDSRLPEVTAGYITHSCNICYIEGGSHWIQQEYPQEVNQYIREYLSQSPLPNIGGASKL